ncbi:precorrin-3B synthase [Rhizobium halophilum]|uniref:precorrin-3B synthase n=1 Tax=Rhizobium halophilum TaxID=2846852 RepID=UPI001EFE28B6|nr:precorrin-3B synthase [Rhizobium halophilum]MCF6370182.1 precorrin-3B synthase [Rhizobium halophilum]
MTTLSLDRHALDIRRGVCPSLTAPMQTGDGLLSRVALIDAIDPAQLTKLCNLALRHGNGIMDVSARGNLQIRGLDGMSAPRLARDVRKLQLPLRTGLAVEVPPFAGFDPTETADPRPVAAAISEGARDIGGLAPKMSVVVDGAGRVRLSGLLADIRLVASPQAQDGGWTIFLGGTETTASIHRTLNDADAIAEVLNLLRRLAADGPTARGRDLATASRTEEPYTASSPIGLHILSAGQAAVGIAPVFGQIRADKIGLISREAQRLKIPRIKPALDHSLIFMGTLGACSALQDYAAQEGFITKSSDPRSAVAACVGSPACASASAATHQLAERAVAEFGDLLDGSFKLHVSGCLKGCAHPTPSPLTLCGTAEGVSFVAGRAGDRSLATVAEQDVPSALRRTAALVRGERRDGENSAACLLRLGLPQVAATFTSGRT